MSKRKKEIDIRTSTDNFWKATSADISRTQSAINTYLYVFGISSDDFLNWLSTDQETLGRVMVGATIVELKRLETECFNFCKAKHFNHIDSQALSAV